MRRAACTPRGGSEGDGAVPRGAPAAWEQHGTRGTSGGDNLGEGQVVPGNGWRHSDAGDRRQRSSDLGEGQVAPGNGYEGEKRAKTTGEDGGNTAVMRTTRRRTGERARLDNMKRNEDWKPSLLRLGHQTLQRGPQRTLHGGFARLTGMCAEVPS